MAKAQSLAVAFGGVSAALGAWYIAMPRTFLETIGIRPTRRRQLVTRLVGVQETSVATALLMDGRAGRWLAMRVGGDVFHGVLLALASRSRDNDVRRLRTAWAAWAAITVSDLTAVAVARQIERTGVDEDGPGGSSEEALKVANGAVHRSVTIARSPDEVYAFWRELTNLPRFMKHLEDVDVIDHMRSRWVARGPGGSNVEWTAIITEDLPANRISWTSTETSEVWNHGTVRFQRAPGGRGTEVHVELDYAPPAGVIGKAVARVMGESPANQISGDLRRLKQILETGELAVSQAVEGGHSRMQRPAQPVPVEVTA